MKIMVVIKVKLDEEKNNKIQYGKEKRREKLVE